MSFVMEAGYIGSSMFFENMISPVWTSKVMAEEPLMSGIAAFATIEGMSISTSSNEAVSLLSLVPMRPP